MSTGAPSVFGPMLTKRAPFRVEDFAQVVLIGYTPLIIVAHPAFPPRNPRELVDYAKANPGKTHWGSSGTGNSPEDSAQWVKGEAAEVARLIELGKLRLE